MDFIGLAQGSQISSYGYVLGYKKRQKGFPPASMAASRTGINLTCRTPVAVLQSGRKTFLEAQRPAVLRPDGRIGVRGSAALRPLCRQGGG